jgi:hypothetical protein
MVVIGYFPGTMANRTHTVASTSMLCGVNTSTVTEVSWNAVIR